VTPRFDKFALTVHVTLSVGWLGAVAALSDVVFGSTVGIIAGHTVTSHEAERPFPVAVTAVPGSMAVMYARSK
jgi:hypothetical protein